MKIFLLARQLVPPACVCIVFVRGKINTFSIIFTLCWMADCFCCVCAVGKFLNFRFCRLKRGVTALILSENFPFGILAICQR